jgi:hypothetical protein
MRHIRACACTPVEYFQVSIGLQPRPPNFLACAHSPCNFPHPRPKSPARPTSSYFSFTSENASAARAASDAARAARAARADAIPRRARRRVAAEAEDLAPFIFCRLQTIAEPHPDALRQVLADAFVLALQELGDVQADAFVLALQELGDVAASPRSAPPAVPPCTSTSTRRCPPGRCSPPPRPSREPAAARASSDRPSSTGRPEAR